MTASDRGEIFFLIEKVERERERETGKGNTIKSGFAEREKDLAYF